MEQCLCNILAKIGDFSFHASFLSATMNEISKYGMDHVDDRIYKVAQKTGPPYLIANILKIP